MSSEQKARRAAEKEEKLPLSTNSPSSYHTACYGLPLALLMVPAQCSDVDRLWQLQEAGLTGRWMGHGAWPSEDTDAALVGSLLNLPEGHYNSATRWWPLSLCNRLSCMSPHLDTLCCDGVKEVPTEL